MFASRFRMVVSLVATIGLAVAMQSAGAQLKYQLTDLGPGTASAINNKGQIVGTAPVGAGGLAHGVRWEQGVPIDLTPNAIYGYATGINNLGDVVGTWTGVAGSTSYLYRTGATVAEPLTPTGMIYPLYATGINDAGTISVNIVRAAGVRRYSHGGICKPLVGGGYALTDLNPSGDVWIQYVESQANAINSKNVIAGAAAGWTGLPDAGYFTSAGAFRRLGDPANGAFSLDVSETNHFCGYYTDWSTDYAFYSRGTGLITLPDLGGLYARAAALNSSDTIVGSSVNLDYWQVACVWVKNKPYDLNLLLSSNPGWSLYFANDINEAGQIVGTGLAPDGTMHAFLLDPIQSVSLVLRPTAVYGGAQTSVGTVTLALPARTGGETVTLSSNNPAAVPSSSSITIPEGTKLGSFTITTSLVGATKKCTIAAGIPEGSASAALTVKPLLASVSVSPNALTGGATTTGTALLGAPAPAGGVTVALGSTNFALTAPTVPSVFIPEGAISATFQVNTFPTAVIKSASITASLAGKTVRALVTVNP